MESVERHTDCRPYVPQAREELSGDEYLFCRNHSWLTHGHSPCGNITTIVVYDFNEVYCSSTCERYHNGCGQSNATVNRWVYMDLNSGVFPLTGDIGEDRKHVRRIRAQLGMIVDAIWHCRMPGDTPLLINPPLRPHAPSPAERLARQLGTTNIHQSNPAAGIRATQLDPQQLYQYLQNMLVVSNPSTQRYSTMLPPESLPVRHGRVADIESPSEGVQASALPDDPQLQSWTLARQIKRFRQVSTGVQQPASAPFAQPDPQSMQPDPHSMMPGASVTAQEKCPQATPGQPPRASSAL